MTLLLLGLALAWANPAFAVDAPHVVLDPDSGSCAICHRAHTASSDTTWTIQAGPAEAAASALILGAWNERGDTGLCFACHGVDSLGSTREVQTAITAASSHPTAPDIGAYGPAPMDCSTCHDSHGTDRDIDGEPYAALLRSAELYPQPDVFQGDEYCATCHLDRPEELWDGLSVWNQTAHAREITPTASGTLIVCSACHEAHGSNIAPLIRETVYPPSTPETYTVPANDRWLCFTCHTEASATYPTGATYQTSSHAVSEATVTAQAAWASIDDARRVGECQTCHNPMGTSDGATGVVPKLATATGRALCERCHNAASEDASDTASFAFPDSEAGAPELVVAWSAVEMGEIFDRLGVWTQETTGTAPRALNGPRNSRVPGSAVDAVAADIDGDGVMNVVVADDSVKRLVVFERNELAALTSVSFSIDATATYLGVGDILLDGSGLPEIAVVTRSSSSPHTSSLYVYRYSAVGPSLARVLGPIALGDDASGIAVGNVRGSDQDDIAVTCMGDDTLRVFDETTPGSGTLTASSYATRRDPRGPSIGDAEETAGIEIAVANSGEVTGTVTLFTGAGSIIGSYDATATAGARAYDTLVADVLPDLAGAETIIALRSDTGTSGFNVYPRAGGGGLGTRQSYTTGSLYNTASLAAGDVDSDGEDELVVGNAGRWAYTSVNEYEPTVQVFSATSAGTAIDTTPVELSSEGVQHAGNPPAVIVADLGGLGESRHPVSVAEGAHVSTETTPFTARHVECSDCHNVHEATSTVPPQGAPRAYGVLKGTWGVSVQNQSTASITYTEKQGVDYEYELCFKCHSGWTVTPFSAGDIASQVNTRNASFHGIETSSTNAVATSDSFVDATPSWSNSSVLYCADCHGNSDADETQGLHTSADAPILSSPYWGTPPDAGALLCYGCHKYSVYASGIADNGPAGSPAGSYFYESTLTEPKLHYLHVGARGFGCESCHASHGINRDHLVRDGVGYIASGSGGSCENGCHSTGSPNPQLHTY